MSYEICWIPCDEIGCANGLVVDSRHVRNFEGRRWVCQEHEASEAQQ